MIFIHAEQLLTYTKNESRVVQCILHAYIKMSVTVLATSLIHYLTNNNLT